MVEYRLLHSRVTGLVIQALEQPVACRTQFRLLQLSANYIYRLEAVMAGAARRARQRRYVAGTEPCTSDLQSCDALVCQLHILKEPRSEMLQ